MAEWPSVKSFDNDRVQAAPADPDAVLLTQEALIEAGAAPVQVDPQELMRQLQAQVAEQQKVIERLAAERGVPVNPQDVYTLALADHLKAQQNANPVHKDSYDDVVSLVEDAVQNAKDFTMDRANHLREVIEDLREKHPQHELAYVRELARSLYRHMRDGAQ